MADKHSGSADAAIGLFLIGCVLAALMWLIWQFQEEQIQSAIRWLRHGQMWLASFFIDDDKALLWGAKETTFGAVMQAAETIPPGKITGEFLNKLSIHALNPYKWFIVAAMGLMALYLYYKGPEAENRTKFSTDTLIKRQSSNFPYITPFIEFNPSKMPPRPPGAPIPADMPLFAEALSPEEWLAINVIPVPDGKPEETATAKAFAQQLGPRWKGPMDLAPYKQIFLAACCLKAVRKRAEADEMLGRLAICWSHDKGLQLNRDSKLLPEARKILKDKKISSGTLGYCNQHAWQTTALIRALFYARSEGGVLSPAQFLWLRGHDRGLWYPLNNLGRKSFHTEALGAMCHYRAEKMAQRPIPRPKVDDAVKSIMEYMASDMSRPIPQIDYSKSKKRGIKKPKGSA